MGPMLFVVSRRLYAEAYVTIAVCIIKVSVPTNTQHTDTQKQCHNTTMILINGTNKTLSN
jgi:hypothetical protein